MAFVLLRKTRVADHVKSLPRPRLTQDVIMVGGREELQDKLDMIWDRPENRSSEDIEVELVITKYKGQKNGTSLRPRNGRRDPAPQASR